MEGVRGCKKMGFSISSNSFSFNIIPPNFEVVMNMGLDILCLLCFFACTWFTYRCYRDVQHIESIAVRMDGYVDQLVRIKEKADVVLFNLNLAHDEYLDKKNEILNGTKPKDS